MSSSACRCSASINSSRSALPRRIFFSTSSLMARKSSSTSKYFFFHRASAVAALKQLSDNCLRSSCGAAPASPSSPAPVAAAPRAPPPGAARGGPAVWPPTRWGRPPRTPAPAAARTATGGPCVQPRGGASCRPSRPTRPRAAWRGGRPGGAAPPGWRGPPAPPRDPLQRRQSVSVEDSGARAPLQQQLGGVAAVVRRRHVQRRLSIGRRDGVEEVTGLSEDGSHHVDLVLPCGDVEKIFTSRGVAIIQVRTTLYEGVSEASVVVAVLDPEPQGREAVLVESLRVREACADDEFGHFAVSSAQGQVKDGVCGVPQRTAATASSSARVCATIDE
eukprot:GHVU01179381.1.p1 GENE.GHVU01179381.1~~GHVU01179381.1.p1  ORF type:complete len:333 (-),score=36.36 GHVU01179381.1:1020-2018(-)